MAWLVVKNSSGEGPGYLEEDLRDRGIEFDLVDLARGDALKPVAEIDGAILLGGTMNADETEKYPYLASERDFINELIGIRKPLLGICLGAQLIARARGAAVKPNTAKEIGFHRIRLTASGRRDPLFAGIPDDLDMFHWHGDRFEIPEGMENMAESALCAHQAFRAGPVAYAVQFHPEVTDRIIDEWTFAGEKDLRDAGVSGDRIKSDAARLLENVRSSAKRIFRNFFALSGFGR